MEEKMRFWWDEKGDVLDISFGKPKESTSREIGDDIIVRFDSKKKEITGFTILNFTKRFQNNKKAEEIDLPLTARICLVAK
ncbi:MAG: DUF2283 domain-containing protein [Candidatus Diapherotrites archaeon]